MNTRANELINNLGLIEHPEGGFFRETYRASTNIFFLQNQNHKGLP